MEKPRGLKKFKDRILKQDMHIALLLALPILAILWGVTAWIIKRFL